MGIGDWNETALQGFILKVFRQEQKRNTDTLPNPATIITTPYLPKGVADGTIIYYQNTTMAAVRAVWVLRYNAASTSAYKWDCIGGNPLTALITGSISNSLTNTWQDMVTPNMAVPLTGDYRCTATAMCSLTAAGPDILAIDPLINGAAPVQNGAGMATIVQFGQASLAWTMDFTTANSQALTTGNTISMGCYTNAAVPTGANYNQRLLSLIPQRLA